MKSARDLIAALFDEQTGVLADRYSSIFSGWKRIAGTDIAAHSRVKDIQHGAIIIEVDHPGWVQMIRLKERRILTSIQKRYPELNIRTIRTLTNGGAVTGSYGPPDESTMQPRENRPTEAPGSIDDPRTDNPTSEESKEFREFHSLLVRLKKMAKEKPDG